jgi:NAD-dependent SIR2 family protein deacetylase
VSYFLENLCAHSSIDAQRQKDGQRPLNIGILLPTIVMYNGPNLFGDEIARIQTRDIASNPDLLLIMGTSISVEGLKSLLRSFANAIKKKDASGQGSMKILYINMEPPASEWETLFDVHVQGSTDDWVKYVLQIWGEDPSLIERTRYYEGIAIKNYKAYRPPPIPDF